jgi:hypothetical protein
VFYAAPPAENRVELARNVASAVAANGVQYLVHISVQAIDSRSFTFANQFKVGNQVCVVPSLSKPLFNLLPFGCRLAFFFFFLV